MRWCWFDLLISYILVVSAYQKIKFQATINDKKAADAKRSRTLRQFNLSVYSNFSFFLLFQQQKQRQSPRSSPRAASPRRAQGSTPRSTSTDPRPCLLSASPSMPERVSRTKTNWAMASSSTRSPQNHRWSSLRIATPLYSLLTLRQTSAKSSKRWRIYTKLNATESTLSLPHEGWRRVMFGWARILTLLMSPTGLELSKL